MNPTKGNNQVKPSSSIISNFHSLPFSYERSNFYDSLHNGKEGRVNRIFILKVYRD
jgi:hypothetical protein